MNYIIAECPMDDNLFKYINKNVDSSLNYDLCEYAEKKDCTIFIMNESDPKSFFTLFAQLAAYSQLTDNGLYGWIKNNGLVEKTSNNQLLMAVKDTNGSTGRHINIITPDNDCYSIDYKSENNFGLMEKSCDKTYTECNINRFQYLGFYKSEIIRNPLIGSLHCLSLKYYNYSPAIVYVWFAVFILLALPFSVWMTYIKDPEYANLRQPWLFIIATILGLIIPLFNILVFFRREYEDMTTVEKIKNYLSMFIGWWFMFLIIIGFIGCYKIFL